MRKPPWRAGYKALGEKRAEAAIVGVILAYKQAPKCAGRGGKVFIVVMPQRGATAEYEPAIRAAIVLGMVGYKIGDLVIRNDIPLILDLYKLGHLQRDSLISGHRTLD
ncbi:MAG: hypothetical protein AAFQ58_09220 [Pseudomonadota bacterium]